jgi:hypothetical protein
MAGENLVKAEWEEVLKGLLSVGLKQRTGAHSKALGFVEAILARTNDLAPALAPDCTHYAVACDLCHRQIHVIDDYVYKAITGRYLHYDCAYRPGLGNEKLPESGVA